VFSVLWVAFKYMLRINRVQFSHMLLGLSSDGLCRRLVAELAWRKVGQTLDTCYQKSDLENHSILPHACRILRR
jgi:hypothetical protein